MERTTRGVGEDVQTEVREYDGNGAVVRVTDANGHVTESVRDGANRLIAEVSGVGTAEEAQTTHKYDAAGNRVETKGPRETGVAYDVRETFDDLNRPVRTEDGSRNVTTRAFDEVGNKVCEKRPLSGAPLSHGGASSLTVEGLQPQVCAGEYVTRYAYDEEGRLLGVTDALGGVYSFVYDADGNLLAKQDARGSLTTYGYDALHRRTSEHQHLDAHLRLTPADRSNVPKSESPVSLTEEKGTLDWERGYDESGNLISAKDPAERAAVQAEARDLASNTVAQQGPVIRPIRPGGTGPVVSVRSGKIADVAPAADEPPHRPEGLAMIIRCETGEDVQVEGDSLVGAKIVGLNLHRALLDGQDLRRADLSGSDLRSAWLEGANLEQANLARAKLPACNASRASFVRANLSEAFMRSGIFEGADFTGADLSNADVGRSRFAGACFDGADLRAIDLGEADLKGSHANGLTKWPAGFDPVAHGVVVK